MEKCNTIACLKKEKAKLLRLAKKQAEIRGKERRAREERIALEKQIANLRKATQEKLIKRDSKINRLIAKARSPETKAKLAKAKSKGKSAFAAFQRFANKYG